jgi:hypothetical protein
MATFTYPTSAEIMQIEQDKLPRLVEDDPIFDLFPMRDVDANLLKWEQLDNYVGLQQIRGINGEPGRVQQTALSQYLMAPGVYGEFQEIDEQELTARREAGTFGTPINISDLVMMCQDKLLNRRLDRVRYILWTLLTTGTFSVFKVQPGAGTVVEHTDTYSLQTSTGTDWSDLPNATPLKDLRATKLLARGHSVQFGKGAKAFANQKTVNYMLNNQNDDDLHGRRQDGLSTVNSLDEFNKMNAGDDLPELVSYDDGYLDDSSTFQPWIPDRKVVIVGKRKSGVTLGEYRFTRNANNPDLGPGPYTRVFDRGELTVPRKIEVHDGHNGGPVIFFPSGVIILST